MRNTEVETMVQSMGWVIVRRFLDSPYDVKQLAARCERSVAWVRRQLTDPGRLTIAGMGRLAAALDAHLIPTIRPKGSLEARSAHPELARLNRNIRPPATSLTALTWAMPLMPPLSHLTQKSPALRKEDGAIERSPEAQRWGWGDHIGDVNEMVGGD